MGYILDGCAVDGQAIHHSDSRQVLNLDGGSAVVDDRAVVDDDEAAADAELWLHDEWGQNGRRWLGSRDRNQGRTDVTGLVVVKVLVPGPLSPCALCSL